MTYHDQRYSERVRITTGFQNFSEEIDKYQPYHLDTNFSVIYKSLLDRIKIYIAQQIKKWIILYNFLLTKNFCININKKRRNMTVIICIFAESNNVRPGCEKNFFKCPSVTHWKKYTVINE